MRLDDLIDNPAQSSFDYPDEEKDNSEFKPEPTGYEHDSTTDDIAKQVIMPSAVNIDDSTEVELVRDGQTVHNAKWGDMIQWLKDNWSELMGRYYITRGTNVLHSFRISGRNRDEA